MMDRRQLIGMLPAIVVFPKSTFAKGIELYHPTPTFDEATRTIFRKKLSTVVKRHINGIECCQMNPEMMKHYFLEGVSEFMKASSAKGTIVDPWSIVMIEDKAFINYQLKTSPHQEDRLTVNFYEHPFHAELKFFPEKS